MARYFVGFLLAVGLIVLVIVLIIRSLGAPAKKPTVLDLNSYANSDVRMQLTIDTPVKAPQAHQDIIMTVDNAQATLVVTKGYDGDTVRMKSYPMTTSAYAVFLRSLAFNGYTKGNDDPSLRDERGRCSLGERYIYEVIDGEGNSLQRYWTTSCGGGTFNGSAVTIRRLFTLQFPDYSALTRDVSY